MNKKFFQLDDKKWLAEQRKTKTRVEIAAEIGCHPHSVCFAERFFSKETKATFKMDRKHIKDS